jgi:hypothetical protein
MSSNHKLATGIDNECKQLIAGLATFGEELKNSRPDDDMSILRSPERVVIQAGTIGMSLSWFRPRAGEEINASIMIAEWEGQVTLPGQTPLEGRHAKQISEEMFHIKQCEDSSWQWDDALGTQRVTSHELAERCVAQMSARMDMQQA